MSVWLIQLLLAVWVHQVSKTPWWQSGHSWPPPSRHKDGSFHGYRWHLQDLNRVELKSTATKAYVCKDMDELWYLYLNLQKILWTPRIMKNYGFVVGISFSRGLHFQDNHVGFRGCMWYRWIVIFLTLGFSKLLKGNNPQEKHILWSL